MKVETACRKLIDAFRSRPTLRAGSLITTVFGDSIAPRGGNVWLGSLIAVMRPFGINERLVRTSVFRLAKDGWLRSEQIGRRSYYSLSADGRSRFDQATQRIYGEPATDWDGTWCMVLLSGLETASKELARKELGWLGYGALSANLLAHPTPNLAELDTVTERLGVASDIVVLSAQTLRNDSGVRRLAHNSWNLDELDARYVSFVKMFRPVMQAVQIHQQVAPETAFLIRTLLIQEYRKVLLRDPLLPIALLPSDWQGGVAYQLCRNLYLALFIPADEYLDHAIETADGPLPPPGESFLERFGGLTEQITT